MNFHKEDINNLDIDEVVKRIVRLNTALRDFWSSAYGWAPIEAAELLSKSRLDWQVSLSNKLNMWISSPVADDDYGSKILYWVNLGSLVEGTLKLFLSIHYKDYLSDIDKIRRYNHIVELDIMELEMLRNFFIKKELLTKDWDEWILNIQQKRNAIHAYKDRDLGSYDEFLFCVRKYLELLRILNERLPYPNEGYIPLEK